MRDKPLVFRSGYSKVAYQPGQKIADVKAAVKYSTCEPLYFRVTIGSCAKEHNFMSFEEAMLFCDVNNLWIDTKDWDDPKKGMLKFYAYECVVTLENGLIVELDID